MREHVSRPLVSLTNETTNQPTSQQIQLYFEAKFTPGKRCVLEKSDRKFRTISTLSAVLLKKKIKIRSIPTFFRVTVTVTVWLGCIDSNCFILFLLITEQTIDWFVDSSFAKIMQITAFVLRFFHVVLFQVKRQCQKRRSGSAEALQFQIDASESKSREIIILEVTSRFWTVDGNYRCLFLSNTWHKKDRQSTDRRACTFLH